ncbi:hypothetical protein HYG86_00715 [Alkalicella caledoniensis]|uniref:DUF4365 domain-containing protein n=1 Tax=Alkalicella caledoniensis TaxID=2731377 RepID=A0A7G9W3Y4_ALKCA|nr:hypothetical protein [Alkalicella caledoniensis]QNO13396.1 hypothetical protein HYG86_00715 [Alkalicella caledoniensis]
MSRIEVNTVAVDFFEKEFELNGFTVEESPRPTGEINFLALSTLGRIIKVKVKAVSRMGSYVNVKKKNFDIDDDDLFMAFAYIPQNESERILYLIPATKWGKDIYPFIGKDYPREDQVSLPEWGINFSYKAKDALEPYRFSEVIDLLK